MVASRRNHTSRFAIPSLAKVETTTLSSSSYVKGERRRTMYFETYRAVGEHVQYERTGDGGWRAAFDGAFTVSTEARTPDAALMELERQLDKLVAEWVVQPRRMGRRAGRGTTSRARRNSVRGPREGAR
jgi:hypothetical protein